MVDQTDVSTAAPGIGRAGGRLTGPHAAVWKYDLLTALSVHALGQGAGYRTTILRLISMVTARYDWRRDEMSVGRQELTRLWDVSEPTVKREINRLKSLGFLATIRPGVRGRVAAYRLGRAAIEAATSDIWPRIGADFAARMSGPAAADNVVSFPGSAQPPEPGQGPQTEIAPWAAALRAAQPGAYRNWFRNVAARREGGDMIFSAPNAFVAHQIETHFPSDLLRAARYEWPDCASVRVEIVS